MTETDVLLINPPIHIVQDWFYERGKYSPRLGLAYLGAYLEQQQVSCRIIDAKFEGLGLDNVVERVKMLSPKLVGISAMTTELPDAALLAETLKKCMPQVKIVLGGIHASVLPDETARGFPCFDFLICGEGEVTLYELVSALTRREHLGSIAGLIFRENGRIVRNRPRPLTENIDALPNPAWHLFPPAQIYALRTSRGCPYQCVFCMLISGNTVRFRDPVRVVEEIETIYERYRCRTFEVSDELFGYNSETTHGLLDLLIRKGLGKKIVWMAQTRVDVINEELLKKMKMAGCSTVGFGIESGNEKILASLRKGITLPQVRHAVALAKKAGLRVRGFFILGLPYDTEKTMRDTIEFASRLETDSLSLMNMCYSPGTKVAHMAERGEGNYRLMFSGWDEYIQRKGRVLEMQDVPLKKMNALRFRGSVLFRLRNFRIAKLTEPFKFHNFGTIFKWFLRFLWS